MKFFKKSISGSADAIFTNVWKSPSLFSFFIVLILLSIQLLLIRPFYSSPDDIFKILAVKGISTANAAPSPFVGYSNIFMGYMLMKLFAWAPSFPWYGWFLCFTQFLTFWVFFWLICLKSSRWFYLLFFIGLWVDIFFVFFALFQFTETALLAAFVGLIVFFMNRESFGESRQFGILIGSSFLVLLSAFIRMDSLLLALFVSTPLMILRFREKEFRDYARRRWILLMFVFFWVLFLAVANFLWYKSDKNWNEYRLFDNARVALQDYRITKYTPETKHYFDSVGWSENDYWLFKNWYYTNPKKFNKEIFNKLGNCFPRVGSEGKPYTCHSLIELFSWDWDSRLMLCFFLLLVFSQKSMWKYLLIQWLWVLFVFLVLIYFFRAPDRVNMPIVAFLVMLAAFYTQNPLGDQKNERWWRWIKTVILLVVFLFSLNLPWLYYKQNEIRRLSQEQMHVYLKMLKAEDDQLYEVWSFPFEELGVFDDLESLKSFHLFINDFCQTCPASMMGLERFGIREPLRDAVNNPNIFLICSAEEGLHYHRYMAETYGEEIYATPIFKNRYFEMFAIHSPRSRN